MISRRAIQGGCVAAGLAILGAALWVEGGTLQAMFRGGPEPQALPEIPLPEQSPSGGRNASRYEAIHQRFGPPPEARSPEVTSLPFSIAGGFMDLGSPEDRYVNIRNSANQERVYKVGEEVERDKARILAIEPETETVRVNWRDREWTLQWKRGAKPPPSASPGETPPAEAPPEAGRGESATYEITQDQFRDYMENFLSKYWQQGAYQVLPDGGVRIRRLDADAEARKYGFRDGDVVRTVNGNALSGLDNITELFMQMRSSNLSELAVGCLRQGKHFEVKIRLK